MSFCVIKIIVFWKMQLFSFLEIKFQNGAHFRKELVLTYFSHFLVTREKTQKYLQHISHLHTYTHIFCLPLLPFLPLQFCKNCECIMYGFSLVGFLFAPFWSNQLITKWWAKFRLECLLLIFIYSNGKFIAICKPWTLNDGRWRLSLIQETQKSTTS